MISEADRHAISWLVMKWGGIALAISLILIGIKNYFEDKQERLNNRVTDEVAETMVGSWKVHTYQTPAKGYLTELTKGYQKTILYLYKTRQGAVEGHIYWCKAQKTLWEYENKINQ
jgi:hypothetical protein